MPGNKSEHVVWFLIWNGICQCKKKQTGYLFENKVGNIAKTATSMHSNYLVRFYPTPAKLGSTHPNTDCLAALNGICTKRNTARFEMLLLESEVNNNSQT